MAKSVARPVSTSFWQDEKVVELFSPEDKYFYLYLLTNPSTTQLGIYHFVPKIAAFELGYSIDAVRVLIDRFEKKYDMIRFSEATNEIAIKNFLRHSVVRGGKPVYDCLVKEISLVKDINLILYIYNNLTQYKDINSTVKDFIQYIYLTYINNDNDNENENERFVHDSSTNRQNSLSENKKSPAFLPPTVEEVDAYCIEMGHEYVDPEAFVNFYTSKNWMIGKNKMVKWRSSVGGWNSRNKKEGKPKYLRNADNKPQGLEKWGL